MHARTIFFIALAQLVADTASTTFADLGLHDAAAISNVTAHALDAALLGIAWLNDEDDHGDDTDN